jgi:transposase InsO family protein
MTLDPHINTRCDELSKMRIEVIPSGTLNYISVEPTLLDQIIMAHLGDNGVQIIKENLNQKIEKYAELYINRIVCLYVLPRTIVSDRGDQLIARFWEQLQESLGTKLIRSSTYHPQTDGQTERLNQILEDMLRACAIDYGKN